MLVRKNDFDLIHSFGRLAALLPVLPIRSLPKIQSYQRAIPWRGVAAARRLGGSSVHFTACSSSMYAGTPRASDWTTVFNGVPANLYSPVMSVAADAPLVFLGRIEQIKGTHHAIEIARLAGRRLVIAGNVEREHQSYFDAFVRPALGERVSYAGPVNDRQKNELLGSSAGLLMPIEWEEPFGIVMVEAMACGTPVIAFRRGSVPEVVDDELTGFIRSDVEGAAAAVAELGALDRQAIRATFERRFSDDAIVRAYVALYERVVRERNPPDRVDSAK
jgi:glycosyltransferase involved in cell wall biosynthesis